MRLCQNSQTRTVLTSRETCGSPAELHEPSAQESRGANLCELAPFPSAASVRLGACSCSLSFCRWGWAPSAKPGLRNPPRSGAGGGTHPCPGGVQGRRFLLGP
eukprot:1795038-Amphidinium_carterae.1